MATYIEKAKSVLGERDGIFHRTECRRSTSSLFIAPQDWRRPDYTTNFCKPRYRRPGLGMEGPSCHPYSLRHFTSEEDFLGTPRPADKELDHFSLSRIRRAKKSSMTFKTTGWNALDSYSYNFQAESPVEMHIPGAHQQPRTWPEWAVRPCDRIPWMGETHVAWDRPLPPTFPAPQPPTFLAPRTSAPTFLAPPPYEEDDYVMNYGKPIRNVPFDFTEDWKENFGYQRDASTVSGKERHNEGYWNVRNNDGNRKAWNKSDIDLDWRRSIRPVHHEMTETTSEAGSGQTREPHHHESEASNVTDGATEHETGTNEDMDDRSAVDGDAANKTSSLDSSEDEEGEWTLVTRKSRKPARKPLKDAGKRPSKKPSRRRNSTGGSIVPRGKPACTVHCARVTDLKASINSSTISDCQTGKKQKTDIIKQDLTQSDNAMGQWSTEKVNEVPRSTQEQQFQIGNWKPWNEDRMHPLAATSRHFRRGSNGYITKCNETFEGSTASRDIRYSSVTKPKTDDRNSYSFYGIDPISNVSPPSFDGSHVRSVINIPRTADNALASSSSLKEIFSEDKQAGNDIQRSECVFVDYSGAVKQNGKQRLSEPLTTTSQKALELQEKLCKHHSAKTASISTENSRNGYSYTTGDDDEEKNELLRMEGVNISEGFLSNANSKRDTEAFPQGGNHFVRKDLENCESSGDFFSKSFHSFGRNSSEFPDQQSNRNTLETTIEVVCDGFENLYLKSPDDVGRMTEEEHSEQLLDTAGKLINFPADYVNSNRQLQSSYGSLNIGADCFYPKSFYYEVSGFNVELPVAQCTEETDFNEDLGHKKTINPTLRSTKLPSPLPSHALRLISEQGYAESCVEKSMSSTDLVVFQELLPKRVYSYRNLEEPELSRVELFRTQSIETVDCILKRFSRQSC